MTEEQYKIVNLQETLAIADKDECKYYQNDIGHFEELCELLNKQDHKINELNWMKEELAKQLNEEDERIRELEGITKRLDRLNNKLIQENTEQCKTCELVKVQHEQIQDLKQQLSKIPDSVKKNWI